MTGGINLRLSGGKTNLGQILVTWKSNGKSCRNNKATGGKTGKLITKIEYRNSSKPIMSLVNKSIGLELTDFIIIIRSWVYFKGLVDLWRLKLTLRTKQEMRKLKNNFRF